ncbi:MAG: FAD-dependent oxidoreductase [Dehalococcoidia bacterium]|nr:FAD-dependent oxidoreductase [Dehalococcoidia bacterium]
MAQQFKHLFNPLRIGTMTVRNRIMSTAHASGMLADNGLPGDKAIAYWASKSRGGIGLVCTQVHGVHRSAGVAVFRQPGVLAAFKKAAEAVKLFGACFVPQIWHPGFRGGSMLTGRAGWSVGSIPEGTGVVPHAMTVDEIKEVIAGYAHAAKVVQEAGCDGVEIHAAHGYLPQQFMTPRYNTRTDEYGGDMKERLRFPLEVINAVREAVGKDFTVGIRITPDELQDGGYDLEAMKIMAPILTSGGKLDYLNVSSGRAIAPMYYPSGHSVYTAAELKQVVDIPVFATSSRISDPVMAEQILANNQADMVGMTRANICDPELSNKAKEGRLDEIRRCIGCSEGCWDRISLRHPLGITCSYNPVVGKETVPGWLDLIPAQTKKKVLVIGGGPAGLETARVAAARGHTVSLYEKSNELGGLVLVAAKAPGRVDMSEVARYYTFQMKLLGINVHLGTEVTAEMVLAQDPDAVVVATGSFARVPAHIPGIEQDNVVDVRQVLNDEVQVGENVVVYDAQRHIHGLSVALFLAERGKKVELIGEDLYFGMEVEPGTLRAANQRVLSAGAVMTPHTGLSAISGNTVVVRDVFTGQERRIEGVDTVVLACGGVENNSLYYALKGKVKEIYRVGDCNGVRKLLWATNDGAVLGRML